MRERERNLFFLEKQKKIKKTLFLLFLAENNHVSVFICVCVCCDFNNNNNISS